MRVDYKKQIYKDAVCVIPINCWIPPCATQGGLAGSTGRDLDARFWQSARFNHASNNHINPRLKNPALSMGRGVLGPFGLIQKIPPCQIQLFDNLKATASCRRPHKYNKYKKNEQMQKLKSSNTCHF